MNSRPVFLQSSTNSLSDAFDLIAFDLDGVIYVGREGVPGASEAVAALRDAGRRYAFVTNNAARPPASVARHLRELGITAEDSDVVTSAQAAARLVADLVPPGAKVYLIGGRGLVDALAEVGLAAVTVREDEPVAVVQGYGPEMPWKQVVAGATLVREGLPWVATNTDMTIPTATGIGPGNGALVELIARFSGRTPVVAGKPSPPLLRETQLRVGGERPLFVGDRLDTDILGARNVGWASLLVMTGVTGPAELASCPADSRPDFIAADLAGLSGAHQVPAVDEGTQVLGAARARVRDGSLVAELGAGGEVSDWWRCVAVALWEHLDHSGGPADVSGVVVPGR